MSVRRGDSDKIDRTPNSLEAATTPTPTPTTSSPPPAMTTSAERGLWVRHVCFFAVALMLTYAALVHVGPFGALAVLVVCSRLGMARLPMLLFGWLGGSSVASSNGATLAQLRGADALMQPVTTKHGGAGGNDRLEYGVSCMQGWRRTMEDAHTIALELPGKDAGKNAFFGVYDGHCGSAVAQHCGDNMASFLASTTGYRAGRYREALTECFVGIDKSLKKNPAFATDRSGCTAVTLLVTDTHILCGNAGDSRCVLCRNGTAIPLSSDHKPYLAHEARRIQHAGGFVFSKRVNGVLALSRAIGDFDFKQRPGIPWEEQAVTSQPDVYTQPLDPSRDEFAVIACDGIWDVMQNQDVVTFVRQRVQKGVALQLICEQLMDNCLSSVPLQVGCDNMSVIIVKFRQPAKDAKDSASP